MNACYRVDTASTLSHTHMHRSDTVKEKTDQAVKTIGCQKHSFQPQRTKEPTTRPRITGLKPHCLYSPINIGFPAKAIPTESTYHYQTSRPERKVPQ